MLSRSRPALPRKLTREDLRDGFDSGAGELDEWLHRYAHQNQQAGSAVTYVSCADGRIVGYYAIAVGAVSRDLAPGALSKGSPREIPCILLARLAVDREYQAHGLGAGLLQDALRRCVMLSDSVGAMAVLIHARDASAKSFYARHLDFHESPLDELQLLIPMKELRKVFGG